ncbi:hypothetical protein MTO96_043467 [Rhipicephalus appendiculatus]
MSWPVHSERVCKILLSMKRLEELHCVVPSHDETFLKMVSELVRASATLTVLDFNAPHMDSGQACLLLNALQANSTLRDLTLSSFAIAADPAMFLAFMSGTVTLKRLRVVGNQRDLIYETLAWIFRGMIENRTVSSLEAHELWLNYATVKMGARMLAHNKALRNIRLWRCLPEGQLFEFVSTTSTLQKLDLQLCKTTLVTKSDHFCRALSVALLRNRSITDLGLGLHVDPCKGVECVGRSVARSETIRKIRLRRPRSNPCLIFLRGFHSGNSENYTLCSATLESEHSYEPWLWFDVRKMARRNSGYVARAAQFLKRTRCDTPCAAALDRVYRHPALVAELSTVLSISETDAVDAVREHFRSIEGMHEFMRLAGVVKARVTCQPRDDGRAQLDALNEHCWAHVRRYLQLDDVVWDRRS